MRTHSRRLRVSAFAISIALGIAAVLGLFIVRRARTTSDSASHGAAGPLRFRWEQGRAYVYALDAHATQHARAGSGAAAQTIDGELTLAGQLVVRCHSATAGQGRYTLGVALHDLSKASLLVAGVEGLGSADEINDKETLVEVDGAGRILRTLSRKEETSTTRFVMQAVLGMMQVTLSEEAASAWSTEESTPLGRAVARYAAGEGNTVTRAHVGYTKLLAAPSEAAAAHATSDDRAVIDRDGSLARLHTNEHVLVPAPDGPRLVAEVRFDLERTRVDAFAAGPLALNDYAVRDADAPVASEDMRRAMKEQLAAGMTLERIDTTATAFGAGAPLPSGFVTSSVALLTLHPEYADELVEMFERPQASSAMRGLLLDILCSAGHPRAQQAMREALDSDAARSDPKYPALLQRLGFVLVPEKATLDFALAAYASATSTSVRAASVYALGSSVGALARQSGAAAAGPYADRLRRDLSRARSDEDKVTLLAALGNASLRADVGLVRGYASDRSARVRKQAAVSLRRAEGEDARGTLMGLLGDEDAHVALASLDALSGQEMGAATLQALASLVGEKNHPPELHEPLVTLAAEHPEDRAAASALLRAVMVRSRDARTLARAKMILEQLGAA